SPTSSVATPAARAVRAVNGCPGTPSRVLTLRRDWRFVARRLGDRFDDHPARTLAQHGRKRAAEAAVLALIGHHDCRGAHLPRLVDDPPARLACPDLLPVSRDAATCLHLGLLDDRLGSVVEFRHAGVK